MCVEGGRAFRYILAVLAQAPLFAFVLEASKL